MAGFYTLSEYLALPRAPDAWVLEPLLPTSGKLLVYGAPKLGKSFAVLQLCAAVGEDNANDWLGFRIHQHGPTFYLQLDTPRSLWAARLEMMAGLRVLSESNNIRFCDREEVPSYPFSAMNPLHLDWLKAKVEELQPVFVVIDTFREAFRGNENDSDVEQVVLANLTLATSPAALVLITHRAKPGETPRDIVDEARGNSYLSGAVDGILGVKKQGFTYVSRTIEQSRLKLSRSPEGLWIPHIPSPHPGGPGSGTIARKARLQRHLKLVGSPEVLLESMG